MIHLDVGYSLQFHIAFAIGCGMVGALISAKGKKFDYAIGAAMAGNILAFAVVEFAQAILNARVSP